MKTEDRIKELVKDIYYVGEPRLEPIKGELDSYAKELASFIETERKEGRLEIINKVRQFNHMNGVLRQEPSTRSMHDFEENLVDEFLSQQSTEGGE